MRRIAFLAAASIAFIEISEPISAYTIKKDKSGCIDKKTKVGKLDCDEINAGPNLVARIDPKNICSFN